MVTYASERGSERTRASTLERAYFAHKITNIPSAECGSSQTHVSHAHKHIYIQFMASEWHKRAELMYIARDSMHTVNSHKINLFRFIFFFIFIFALFWPSPALPSFLSFLSRAWLILFYPRANFQRAPAKPSQAKPKHFVYISVSVSECECVSNAELNLRSLETLSRTQNTTNAHKHTIQLKSASTLKFIEQII